MASRSASQAGGGGFSSAVLDRRALGQGMDRRGGMAGKPSCQPLRAVRAVVVAASLKR